MKKYISAASQEFGSRFHSFATKMAYRRLKYFFPTLIMPLLLSLAIIKSKIKSFDVFLRRYHSNCIEFELKIKELYHYHLIIRGSRIRHIWNYINHKIFWPTKIRRKNFDENFRTFFSKFREKLWAKFSVQKYFLSYKKLSIEDICLD